MPRRDMRRMRDECRARGKRFTIHGAFFSLIAIDRDETVYQLERENFRSDHVFLEQITCFGRELDRLVSEGNTSRARVLHAPTRSQD